LITPYILSYWVLSNPETWLLARTYSLVVNQGLRGSQMFWIFVPDGNSVITDAEGDNASGNQRVRLLWGLANLTVALALNPNQPLINR
jgi:hypothetical protein